MKFARPTTLGEYKVQDISYLGVSLYNDSKV